MHKISLREWVLLLTILPTLVIGLSLAGYFSVTHYFKLEDFLTTRAKSIIEPIAIASTELLQNNEREKLRDLIGVFHRNHSEVVKSITIFTRTNQIFVTSAYNSNIDLMRLNPEDPIPEQTQVIVSEDKLIVRTPIINDTSELNHLIDNASTFNILGYVAIHADRQSIQYSQQTETLIAVAIALLGALISSFFSVQLIRKVTRPITSMVQAVDRIREGKLESRVSGQLMGELNFLKNGINSMAQQLGDYHDEMQRSVEQATVDLRESLEQFEIQNVELDLAKRKAQQANKVKSEFLANMSHELRTPLNGVIGFTRQVLKTPLSETQRDYLQTIEGSANNLLTIINDILDFSKLDAGKMVIENIPFALRESVEETLTLLAPSAHNKNIELSLRIGQQLPDSLVGDAMRIKQVLTNIVNNAIKFTEKGSVTIDVDGESLDDGQVVIKISVTDTGIGISNTQQKHIFEAFSQADKSVTRLYGGTGLGLVISRHLAKEMHGDVGFSSEEQGGSTFWFTFQCELNPLPLSSPINSKELYGKHILYFEAKEHTREATNEILTGWGMDVASVTNLKDLLALLHNEQRYDYALIGHDISPTSITDLKQLTESMRPYVPSIHLAINSNSPNLHDALIASGAHSCLSKPLTPIKLYKALLPMNQESRSLRVQTTSSIVPIKVLAVDDNEANLKLIKALLEEQVSSVYTASNGEEALALCQAEKFAMIFMDIQMPIMDGVTALKQIKRRSRNEDAPIIAVTAHALNSEKEQLLEQGFSAYMTKPIDESMLRHIIYEYCDLNLFTPAQLNQPVTLAHKPAIASDIFDLNLALNRAANNRDLAIEMFDGLLSSLPETRQAIRDAMTSQNQNQLKSLIHKLNGACCYTGVPNLAFVTQQIETELKKGTDFDLLEPEFFEFFEHIDALLNSSNSLLISLQEPASNEDNIIKFDFSEH